MLVMSLHLCLFYICFLGQFVYGMTQVARTHIPIYDIVPMGNKDLTYVSLPCGLHHRCEGCLYLDTMLKMA
jgi:hypothetical protein